MHHHPYVLLVVTIFVTHRHTPLRTALLVTHFVIVCYKWMQFISVTHSYMAKAYNAKMSCSQFCLILLEYWCVCVHMHSQCVIIEALLSGE